MYKIKFCHGQLTYIGETNARDWLNTSKRQEIANGRVSNHINAEQRLTLESWFTNLEQTPLNRSHALLE